jgi:L-rhamnose mutarotase
MKLKSGAVDEYKRRHDEIWPEVVGLLREHGFSDYSIFLDEQTKRYLNHEHQGSH